MKSSLMLFFPLTLVAFVGVACGDDEAETSGSGGSATTGSSMGGNTSTSTTSGMGGDASTSTTTTTTGGMGGSGGGCTPEPGCYNWCDFTPTASVDFATQVLPILQTSCLQGSCHGADNGMGGRFGGGATAVYNSITSWNSGDTSQPVIDPGNAANSYLMIKMDGDMACSNSLCSNDCGKQMPEDQTPATAAERDIVRSWIENGAASP